MKTHPRRMVLKKIASHREKAERVGPSPAWTRFISIDPPASIQPGCSALLLGRRILTRREMDVLLLVARGETDQRIADRLYLSRRTVNTHVSHILAKLDVSSRREAVVAAARLGLI